MHVSNKTGGIIGVDGNVNFITEKVADVAGAFAGMVISDSN